MTDSFVSAGLDLCALLLPSVFAGANYQGSMFCRFQTANTRGSRKSKRVREQLQSALFTLNVDNNSTQRNRVTDAGV